MASRVLLFTQKKREQGIRAMLFLCLTVFLSGTTFAVAPQGKKVLSLDQAIEKALRQRVDLAAYDKLIEALDWQARSSLMGYAPTINFQGSLTAQKHQQGLHGAAILSGNQLIYQWGGPIDKYRRDKKYKKEQVYNKEQAAHQLRFAVEQAFLSTWLLQKQEPVMKAIYKAAVETYKQANHEWQLQLLDRSVYYSARASFATAQESIRQFYADLEIARYALAFLLGEDFSVDLARFLVAQDKKSHHKTIKQDFCELFWQTPTLLHLKPLAFYQKQALCFRPDLKAKDEQLKALALDKKIIAQSSLPIFGISASVAHDAAALPGNKTALSIGPSVSWQIFDGMQSDYQSRRANAAYLAESLKKEFLSKQITQEVARAYYILRKAISQLNAQRPAFIAAYNLFSLRRDEMALGDISSVEFTNAQANWRQEYQRWLSAIVEVIIRERELAFICGYPYDNVVSISSAVE